MARIDEAAASLGLSRSDFLRRAASDLVSDVVGGGDVGKVGVRGRGLERPQMLDAGCPKNSYCLFVRSVSGSRVCGTCGVER